MKPRQVSLKEILLMTGKDCTISTSSSAGRLCKPVTSGSVGKLAIGVIAGRTGAGFGWIVVRFLRPRRQKTVRSLVILRIVAFHSVGEMSFSRSDLPCALRAFRFLDKLSTTRSRDYAILVQQEPPRTIFYLTILFATISFLRPTRSILYICPPLIER